MPYIADDIWLQKKKSGEEVEKYFSWLSISP